MMGWSEEWRMGVGVVWWRVVWSGVGGVVVVVMEVMEVEV
jgi:hypothetical protein